MTVILDLDVGVNRNICYRGQLVEKKLRESLERNTEVFPHHFLGASSTLLIWTGGSY